MSGWNIILSTGVILLWRTLHLQADRVQSGWKCSQSLVFQQSGRSARLQASDSEHPRTHPVTDISELLSHLLWKLGLWMIWESFPNESIVSTGSSVWAVLCPGWSGTSSPGYEAWTSVLILGRNCARAGAPRSRPCSLCRWFPRLSRAPWLTDM